MLKRRRKATVFRSPTLRWRSKGGLKPEDLPMWGKGTDSRWRSRIEWLKLLLPRRSSRAGLFLETRN